MTSPTIAPVDMPEEEEEDDDDDDDDEELGRSSVGSAVNVVPLIKYLPLASVEYEIRLRLLLSPFD